MSRLLKNSLQHFSSTVGRFVISSLFMSCQRAKCSKWIISNPQVVDCRMCGDPKTVLRFAFIEFTDEGKLQCSVLTCYLVSQFWDMKSPIIVWAYANSEGARAALNLSGTMLGFYPVKVLPSKTAIAPVNPTFLPRVWGNWLLDSFVSMISLW